MVLLNEKSDDDDVEARAGLKKQSELLQELLKDNEERKPQNQNQNDTLLQSLGFSSSPSPPNGGDPARARKRPSEDHDDYPVKRPSDGSQVSSSGSTGSKLCEKNKMLASLLAKTPSNHQPIPPVPASVISATPQEKLPRINDPNLNKNRMATQAIMLNNSRPRLPGRPPNANYLNQLVTPEGLQRNQNRQYNQVDSSYVVAASADSWVAEQSSDPLLSIILDQVIDIVPDAVMTNPTDIQTLLDAMSPQNTANNFQQNEPMSEMMAINIIQKSLMQCETAVKSPSSPTISLSPAYSTNTMTQSNQAGQFPPPPNYPRLGNLQRPQVRQGAPQYPISSQQLLHNQQLRKQQQLQLQQQQQENKRRLLERQSQQQLLIPSNATAAEINSGLQNIDSLLNNTVAPNVSLQRSSSVPESQLSPNYRQQPYSPHAQLTSPIGQQAGFPQGAAPNYQQAGARLSPQQFTQQLSPRQGYPQANAQTNNWQQTAGRLTMQQQQNPMLNAQLTGNYVPGPNGRAFPVQRSGQQQPRAVGSPGAASATRHSPFSADQFAPPASPNSGYNQSQYTQRLNRTNSAPIATTQLPGGLGSPRPYTRDHPAHTYPQIPPNPHHPMMYQQEYACYDQTSLQLSYNGVDRGRAPPHLQAGVSTGGGGPASEYVRQELRAVVGARTGQQITPGSTTRTQSQAQQLLTQNVNAAELEALGLTFEMPNSGASESPKLWGAMGSEMGSMSPPQAATSRNTMEEGRQGDHKSSLLQKLLSE